MLLFIFRIKQHTKVNNKMQSSGGRGEDGREREENVFFFTKSTPPDFAINHTGYALKRCDYQAHPTMYR